MLRLCMIFEDFKSQFCPLDFFFHIFFKTICTGYLQDHQNNCNFLIHSGDNVHQLDMAKLEQKFETLLVKVSTLEKKVTNVDL